MMVGDDVERKSFVVQFYYKKGGGSKLPCNALDFYERPLAWDLMCLIGTGQAIIHGGECDRSFQRHTESQMFYRGMFDKRLVLFSNASLSKSTTIRLNM